MQTKYKNIDYKCIQNFVKLANANNKPEYKSIY